MCGFCLERFPLPLGAWEGLCYFIVTLPEPSYNYNNVRNVVVTLAPSFLIGSSSFLQFKCLNEFKFRPDPTSDYGTFCPWASENSNHDVVATLAPSVLIESSFILVGNEDN